MRIWSHIAASALSIAAMEGRCCRSNDQALKRRVHNGPDISISWFGKFPWTSFMILPRGVAGNGGLDVNIYKCKCGKSTKRNPNTHIPTVYTQLTKAYTSILGVVKKIGELTWGISSSGALNIQPDGTGHASPYLSLDKRAFNPISLMHGRPSSVIMILDWGGDEHCSRTRIIESNSQVRYYHALHP